MSPLQWALLVLAVAVVAGIYWLSRPRTGDDAGDDGKPAADQLDLWKSGGGNGQFDEYGVGEPRRAGARREPVVDGSDADDASPVPADESGNGDDPRPEKIIAFYIAEREGTYILGPQLHAALNHQGLKFGERRIYHRLHDGQPVFSVASLLKPGELDPEQAAGFSTPGLSVFMVLPGPQAPAAAFDDMLSTAQALAGELNAALLDAERQPVDDARASALRYEVSEWARVQGEA